MRVWLSYYVCLAGRGSLESILRNTQVVVVIVSVLAMERWKQEEEEEEEFKVIPGCIASGLYRGL